jgi:hypothetical protein
MTRSENCGSVKAVKERPTRDASAPEAVQGERRARSVIQQRNGGQIVIDAYREPGWRAVVVVWYWFRDSRGRWFPDRSRGFRLFPEEVDEIIPALLRAKAQLPGMEAAVPGGMEGEGK